MRWRLAFLGALLLPDLALDPFHGGLAATLRHPLGTDDLGRDALLRLALAAARSLGFASTCALLALGLGLLLAWRGQRFLGAWSALRARIDRFRHSPAWAAERTLGAPWPSTLRRWAPWGWQQAAALFPSAWLSALWGEATLSTLGLGPGPGQDSLGRLLSEELPRIGSDPSPLGWAALAMVLALAWVSTPGKAA